VFYTLTRIAKTASGGHNDLARPWLDWVQNLTLTQWVSLPFHPVADGPQNPKLLVAAFWSLNYEDQFYLVMAAALLVSMRYRLPVHATVAALAVVGLVWNSLVPDDWITGFFIEYWAHFALGALLFYTLCVVPSRTFRYLFLASVAALGLYSVMRMDLRAYSEFVVACAFTLFLYFIRPVSAAVSGWVLWRPIGRPGDDFLQPLPHPSIQSHARRRGGGPACSARVAASDVGAADRAAHPARDCLLVLLRASVSKPKVPRTGEVSGGAMDSHGIHPSRLLLDSGEHRLRGIAHARWPDILESRRRQLPAQ